jgi:hypothetical protein
MRAPAKGGSGGILWRVAAGVAARLAWKQLVDPARPKDDKPAERPDEVEAQAKLERDALAERLRQKGGGGTPTR